MIFRAPDPGRALRQAGAGGTAIGAHGFLEQRLDVSS
jgi:hypothetical protein